MQTAGLSAADLRVVHRTLLRGYERRITAEIQTLDGKLLRHLSLQVIDGQVDVDVTAEVSRTLTLRFVDPTRSLHFEPHSPGAAPLHRSRRIQIGYSVRVPELGRWVTFIVFTGPIWDFKREGAVVDLIAHGMERQALGSRWHPRGFAKKSRKTTAIRTLLADCGETRLGAIPDLPDTFPGRFTIARMDQPWLKAKKVAASLDRHLFYDGAGIPRLRPYPNRPVFTFNTALLDEPSIHRTVDGLVNIVEVVGAKPKGSRQHVAAIAALPASNANSPEALARNGKPLYLGLRVENSHIKTKAAAFARARRVRDEHARTIAEFGFPSLPIPHLDEHDLVSVHNDEGLMLVRMKQWTIPLGGSDAGGADGPPMTVGSNRRTVAARRKHSKHRGHR